MQTRTTDVLVVGAGPVGLATAIGLARHNVDFLIVDALAEAQNTSRAAVIHAATLESLDRLGVARQLISQGIQVPGFRIRDRDTVLLHTEFSKLPVETPYALMIPQDESEAIMTAELASLGHEIQRPVRFVGHDVTETGVKAIVDGDGERYAIEARYLVGTDGEKSAVRASADIVFPGETYGSFMLADVHMDWPIAKSEVTLFFSGAGTLVVAPMSKDRFRVVAQLRDAPPNPNIRDVQRVIDERGPRSGARVRDVLWGARFQVHHKLADTFRKGPVILAGDAAHVHSPAGGQGMNLGLRDAEALGRSIPDALRHGHPTALDTYARDRRKVAEDVLAMTDRLTRIATLGNPVARWLRNRVIAVAGLLPVVRRYAARTLAGYR
jgi:2-polyprenyl-6-methoxyphenol hydroxylase-like FAD-dependent oxidoreductase